MVPSLSVIFPGPMIGLLIGQKITYVRFIHLPSSLSQYFKWLVDIGTA